MALYLTSPPHTMDKVEENGVWNLFAMIEDVFLLGLVGTELPISLADELTDGVSKYWNDQDMKNESFPWPMINLSMFTLFYIYYILMSIVLLLNLLIAQMGDVYASADAVSSIDYRVRFARRILLYEDLSQLPPCYRRDKGNKNQVASFLGLFELNAGIAGTDSSGNPDYYVQFRSVSANTEGGGTGGVRPTFKDTAEDLPPPTTVPQPQMPKSRSADDLVSGEASAPPLSTGSPGPVMPPGISGGLPMSGGRVAPLLAPLNHKSSGSGQTPSAPITMEARRAAMLAGSASVLPSPQTAAATPPQRKQSKAVQRAMGMQGLEAEPTDTTFIDEDDMIVDDDGDEGHVRGHSHR